MSMIASKRLSLAPPDLPQSDHGIIDVSKQQNPDLIIRIYHYEGEKPYDKVIASIGSIQSQPYFVSDPPQWPLEITIPFSEIPDDHYQVTYSAQDVVGNPPTLSQPAAVIIKNSPSTKYQAPTYPDAQSGVIYYSALEQHNGLRVHICYSAMAQGDALVFHWSGMSANGDPITEACWQSDPITVSASDIRRGYVELVVPDSAVLCLEESGQGRGTYSCGTTTSARGAVLLSLSDISPAKLLASYGAPPLSSDYSQLKPKNTVKVYGPPGRHMVANINEGVIMESGKQIYHFQPASNGLASFNVQSTTATTINCIVSAVDGGMDAASIPTTFSNWRDGEGAIAAWAASIPAPADGYSRCVCYVIVDRSSWQGRLTVTTDGHAQISGFYDEEAQHAQITPGPDGYAIFSIENTVAEDNQVTIGYPGISDLVKFTINFKNFPY